MGRKRNFKAIEITDLPKHWYKVGCLGASTLEEFVVHATGFDMKENEVRFFEKEGFDKKFVAFFRHCFFIVKIDTPPVSEKVDLPPNWGKLDGMAF